MEIQQIYPDLQQTCHSQCFLNLFYEREKGAQRLFIADVIIIFKKSLTDNNYL